jgi:hypothetical protein
MMLVVGLAAGRHVGTNGPPNAQPAIAYGAGLTLFACVGAIRRLVMRAKGSRANTPAGRPEGIPSQAVPASAFVRRGATALGTASGWIWFEDGFLYFQGDRFNCRIVRSAVRNKDAWRAIRSQQGLRLDLPHALPNLWIRFTPRHLDDAGLNEPQGWRRLKPDFENWRQSRRLPSDSILPPIRSRTRPASGWRIGGEFLGLSIFVGSIGAAIIALSPSSQAGQEGAVPITVLAVIILVLVAGLPLTTYSESHRLDSQVNEAQRRLGAAEREAIAQ